jgi:DNA uptake protein ComE-like DNA-binding protein
MPDDFDWESLWEKRKIPVLLGLTGLLLVSVGIFSALFYYRQSEPEIEIIAEEEAEGTIWADLAGAVERPGVYELPAEARIKDLLARAGGLSAEADREWVEKEMNLAQKLEDGAKIYIYHRGERVEDQEGGEVAGSSASLAGD